jgi:uncharacterized membrane protein
MGLYNAFKFLHVISVITWVGGGVMMQALAMRARAASSTRLVDFAQDAAWTGNHVFMPASFATLIFGLATAFAKPFHWGFHPMWVKLGLLGWLLTAVNGAANLGRISKKLAAQTAAGDGGVQATARRLLMMMNIDLVIVLLVVADMVFKPT